MKNKLILILKFLLAKIETKEENSFEAALNFIKRSKNGDKILLKGVSGTGKTKLTKEFLKNHKNKDIYTMNFLFKRDNILRNDYNDLSNVKTFYTFNEFCKAIKNTKNSIIIIEEIIDLEEVMKLLESLNINNNILILHTQFNDMNVSNITKLIEFVDRNYIICNKIFNIKFENKNSERIMLFK